MVAVKNLLTGCLRGVAVVVLIIEGAVNWGYGLPMALGGFLGGYLGGRMSHRANRNVVRGIVIALGFGVAAYYFWRLYSPPIMHVAGEWTECVVGHGSSASRVTHTRSSGSPTGEYREDLSGSLVNKVFVCRIAIAGIYDPGQYVPPRLCKVR